MKFFIILALILKAIIDGLIVGAFILWRSSIENSATEIYSTPIKDIYEMGMLYVVTSTIVLLAAAVTMLYDIIDIKNSAAKLRNNVITPNKDIQPGPSKGHCAGCENNCKP